MLTIRGSLTGSEGGVVRGDGFVVFPKARNVAGNGVLGYLFGFGQGASIGNASGKRGHNNRETAFGFRSQNDVEMAA